MPSRRDQRSENRQPSRRRNRPEWRHWTKRWSSFTTKKPEESSQQETDALSKAAYVINAFGQLQSAGLFPDDHPAIKSHKAELNQAKAASDESVLLSKRIRAGQNQIACVRQNSKRPKSVRKRPSKTLWLPRRAWSSTGPRLKTSGRRYSSDGTTWSIYTEKREPRHMKPKPRSWMSCSQTVSPSTCFKRGEGQLQKRCRLQ